MYSSLLDISSGVELLINRVCIFSALIDSADQCSKWLYQLRSHEQGHIFRCSLFVSALGIVSLFHFNPFL